MVEKVVIFTKNLYRVPLYRFRRHPCIVISKFNFQVPPVTVDIRHLEVELIG